MGKVNFPSILAVLVDEAGIPRLQSWEVQKINGHETIMDIVGSGLTYKEAKNLILVLNKIERSGLNKTFV